MNSLFYDKEKETKVIILVLNSARRKFKGKGKRQEVIIHPAGTLVVYSGTQGSFQDYENPSEMGVRFVPWIDHIRRVAKQATMRYFGM